MNGENDVNLGIYGYFSDIWRVLLEGFKCENGLNFNFKDRIGNT